MRTEHGRPHGWAASPIAIIVFAMVSACGASDRSASNNDSTAPPAVEEVAQDPTTSEAFAEASEGVETTSNEVLSSSSPTDSAVGDYGAQGLLRANVDGEAVVVPGVTLRLKFDDGTEVASTVTGQDGGWELRGTEDVPYLVELDASSLPPEWQLRNPESNPLLLTPRPGDSDISTVLFPLGAADRLVTTHLTTPDGWEYDFSFELPVDPIYARSSIANSPPGLAALELSGSLIEFDYVGTLEGRNAPDLPFRLFDYIWSAEGPSRFDNGSLCDIDDPIDDQGRNVWCSTLPLRKGDVDPSEFRSRDQNEPWFESSVEADEVGVDAWVQFFEDNPTPDYVLVQIDQIPGCTMRLGYDGSVTLVGGEGSPRGVRQSDAGCEVRPT